ncbi:MAG: ABC transporter substrate-binding protein, partial [Pararhizobium sp.]
RLEAKGFRRLIDVNRIAMKLGARGPVPAIGYVFDEDWADHHEAAVKAFLKASRDAEEVMKTSDAEWLALKPITGAADDRTLRVLRDRFREGIPTRPLADAMKDTARIYAILAKVGGERLVGPSKTLAEGTFWSVLTGGS